MLIMLRRASSSKSTVSRRSSSVTFDEFGFAFTKKRDQKLQHRCHDYSYPQPNPVKVKELCEFLGYWNGSSFLCRNQIERFIRIGIPPAIRGRVWKSLLNIESLRSGTSFDYETCQAEIRRPLVDLGVSEYSIISSIDSLMDTENEIRSGQAPKIPCTDLTLFKQITLDLRRSFPTHRTLMGDLPEAIEGQAKLFRVLSAFARYNPQVGYTQGMSYIAAVLLMILSEEEAFWALVALLEKPKFLSELFDSSLKKIQHQALEALGVSSVHFIMQWFLTLFTALPCWDSVLAIWDLILLQGLRAMFRTGLTIIQLLESRIMNMSEEAAVLPVLLRVPVDVSQHCVLIPALWSTDVQDWEINCMNNLVLDEAASGQEEVRVKQESSNAGSSSLTDGPKDVEPSHELVRKSSRREAPGSGPKNVFTRLLKVAQHYFLESGRYRPAARSSLAGGLKKQHKTRGSPSITPAQVRGRRSSSRRSQNSSLGGVRRDKLPSQNSDEGSTEDSTSSSAWRVRSGPVGKVALRRSQGLSRRGNSLQEKSRGSRSQRTPPEMLVTAGESRNGESQGTPDRRVYTQRPSLSERNFLTCPVSACLVRESQLI
ncbi:hypothetical protein DNTS_033390 [Danionella cerebrum]|uniref:Rab-GAP TBC domain-containing protein n=1 Tax=Danionella cerebrum TaxID=2873325 RepID=A0A553MMX8_9TELE|nr:hypothetical protein DNTS_033390 [Danionella translucida]